MVKKVINEGTLFDLLDKLNLASLLHEELKKEELLSILKKASKKIYLQFFSSPQPVSQDREFLILFAFVLLTPRMDKLLPYWIDTQKFHWENFSQNYENLSKVKLLEIINFSVQH